MPKIIHIPNPLRKHADDEGEVVVSAATVGDAIEELHGRFPRFKERLMDDDGEIRRSLNIYVNEENIRFLQNLSTPLKDGDEVTILPAISGG